MIEDNGYAISVPVEVQTAGGSISKLVTGFPNLFIQEVDGCDPMASYETMQARGRLLPRAPRTGAGSRPCDPAVLAFAIRR